MIGGTGPCFVHDKGAFDASVTMRKFLKILCAFIHGEGLGAKGTMYAADSGIRAILCNHTEIRLWF